MKKIRSSCIIFGILFIISLNFSYSQNLNRTKIGFISGYGGQDFLKISYDYHVLFFQGQYYYTLLPKKTWGLELIVQPQYNLVKYKRNNEAKNYTNGYDLGINAGILVRKNIVNDNLSSYILLSSGPHYASGTPPRQANGFTFSDNLLIGLTVKISNNLFLDIRTGIRHMSNAGLKHPNGGINNFVLSGGLMLNLGSSSKPNIYAKQD